MHIDRKVKKEQVEKREVHKLFLVPAELWRMQAPTPT